MPPLFKKVLKYLIISVGILLSIFILLAIFLVAIYIFTPSNQLDNKIIQIDSLKLVEVPLSSEISDDSVNSSGLDTSSIFLPPKAYQTPLIPDEILKDYLEKKGLIRYFFPDSMRIGHSDRIKVQIKKGLLYDVEDYYPMSLEVKGLTEETREVRILTEKRREEIDTIRISSYVRVDIYDPAKKFILNPLFANPERKIDSLTYTSWTWEVSPTEKGLHSLVVNVTTKLYNNETEEVKELKVYEKEIKIQANKLQEIQEVFLINTGNGSWLHSLSLSF